MGTLNSYDKCIVGLKKRMGKRMPNKNQLWKRNTILQNTRKVPWVKSLKIAVAAVLAIAIAGELGLKYLNTAETLRDGEGFLRAEYCADDGYHLNTAAYKAILWYIRTHPCKEDI